MSAPRVRTRTGQRRGVARVGKNTEQPDASTVILRNSLPKYGNFVSARKLDRDQTKIIPQNNQPTKFENLDHLRQSDRIRVSPPTHFSSVYNANPPRHINTNSGSQHGKVVPMNYNNSSDQIKLTIDNQYTNKVINGSNLDTSGNYNVPCLNLKDKPVNIVDPVLSKFIPALPSLNVPLQLSLPALPSPSSHSLDSNLHIVPSAHDWHGLQTDQENLSKANESLENELGVELQVNSELKKLLVASVGDDLHTRIERLLRDKAELSAELGDFAKKMMTDYEKLDSVSIQADMWKTKYLASRVMADELAQNKSLLCLRFHESQTALQEMLTERHVLRKNLLDAYRYLFEVKGAFESRTTQRGTDLISTNVIDLAKTNELLAEDIRHRLLPIALPSSAPGLAVRLSEDQLTIAENLAIQILMKNMDESDSTRDLRRLRTIERFHPHSRSLNVTYNCCVNCTGELHLV